MAEIGWVIVFGFAVVGALVVLWCVVFAIGTMWLWINRGGF